MLTRVDITNISKANEVRNALIESRNRTEGYSEGLARVSGPRYSTKTDSSKIPIVDQRGKPFANAFLSNNQSFVLPSTVPAGSIVEYRDSSSGEYYYGRVNTFDEHKKTFEVMSITKSEADELVQGNPQTKVYSLGEDDTQKKSGSPILKTLMSLLDPSENIVFKLMTLLLLGNIFESESITDVFMGVYIRVIALAIAIIAIIYTSTVVFS